MLPTITYIIARLASFGVIHREEAKNNKDAIRRLLRLGFVRKVHRGKKVFYELTQKAIPLLEARRKAMLEEARILAALHKPPSVYHALINDVRFLDEKHRGARKFRLLGDWQLTRSIVPSQLELAKLRYYKQYLQGVQDEI